MNEQPGDAGVRDTRRRRRAPRLATAIATGLGVGYVGERLLARGRLSAPAVDGAGVRIVPVEMPPGEVRTIEGPDGVQVAVESFGDRDAPQIVLTHGWMCQREVWCAQVAALADRYRVVTFDQPGHGESSAPASGVYDLDLLGDTLAAVLEQATRPGRVLLVGHSLGGMALLNAADRRREVIDERVGGVVLVSTTSRARRDRRALLGGIEGLARFERILRRLAPRMRESNVIVELHGYLRGASSDLSRLLVRWMGLGPHAPATVVAFAERMLAEADPDVSLGLVAAVAGVDEDDGLGHLVAVGIPVTVLVGGRDRLTPRALSARMVDRGASEFIEVPGVGHLLPLEDPAVVNAAIERHLRRMARPGPRSAAPSAVRRGPARRLARRLIGRA